VFQFLGYALEAFVFAYLGLTLFSYQDFKWSPQLFLVELGVIMLGRMCGTLGLVAVGEAAVLPALARALLPVEADTTATSKVWVSTSTSHAAIVHITTILAVGETASVPTVALALLPVVANATAAGLLTEPSVEATIEASTVVVPTPISLRAVTADVAGLAAGVTGQCRLL